MNQTYRVHLTQPTEVIVNGSVTTVQAGSYTVDSLEFCKENDFMQCHKCKEWFDEVQSVTQYHPQFNPHKQPDYCLSCFDKVYK